MRHLNTARRARAVACLLAAAGALGPTLLAGGAAQAATCGTAVTAGTSCTATGTLSLSTGTLSMTSPSSLSWAATLSGADQQVVDTHTADQGYTVNDATGSGAGWHATVSATQFTTGGGTPSTLVNTGTFSTNGSVSSISATTAPATACGSGSTCTLPTNTATYPVAITTGGGTPTPFTMYDTSAGTGEGTIAVSGVGWWLAVPANTPSGTYTSTVTLELISGP